MVLVNQANGGVVCVDDELGARMVREGGWVEYSAPKSRKRKSSGGETS